MIKGLDYWCDFQMKRFLEQIVRAFSGFQYMTGWRELPDGTREEPQLRTVPCRLGSTDRLVAHVMRNLSENTLLSVPMITINHVGLAGRREDLQHPGHVDTRAVSERAIDPDTGEYTAARGRSYTVQRVMPRPFEMNIQVDLWTSNTHQKHQISEQILTVIYPDFAIQNSDNPLDWAALTYMYVEDIQWSSRSIPIGTESEIDIMTINLRLPFWLSPPAKVMQQKIIEQIVTNIHDGRSNEEISDSNYLTRVITTPGNHAIRVETTMTNGEANCTLTLLGPEGNLHTPDGSVYSWQDLINLYGLMQPDSKLRLRIGEIAHNLDNTRTMGETPPGPEVIGTIAYTTVANKLSFQIIGETLPGNTLQPVNAVIDPNRSGPGIGLPAAAAGQRYLIISEIAGNEEHPNPVWGPLAASTNDIIEYRNGKWEVVFDAQWLADTYDEIGHVLRDAKGNPIQELRNAEAPEYVLNSTSGRQLRWNGFDWVLTIDGDYGPGYWRLAL